MHYSFSVALVVALNIATSAHSAERATPNKHRPIGSEVGDFAGKDCYGTNHTLSEMGRDKLVVLGFLGVECPLVNLYAPRLSNLARRFVAKGVVFIGIDANRQDSITEIASFVRRNAIPFVVLKDLRQNIADRVGATRTPQVVVLDRERRIRYRGRIDDQFGFLSTNRASTYQRRKPERNELQAALEELLAEKPVSDPETNVAGCLIGRDREPAAAADVTYAKDVARILDKNCVSCHRPGQIAPFSLTSYEDVAGWADMIVEVTDSNRMPPWHADSKFGEFANDARLSDRDKRTLARWADLGAPSGDPHERPLPPNCVQGWTIPEPDEVLYMSEVPFDVPAEGVIEYQEFSIDPGWKEDRWITAIEPRPGNPSVVHHILIFVIPPEGDKIEVRSDNAFFAPYAPGLQPVALPSGFARLIRAGSKLVFNMHYVPNGTPQEDRSYVGIKFADPKTVRREVVVSTAVNTDFEIPPHSADYEVRSYYVFKRDSLLLSLLPHMHLRGKDFLYEAVAPNGGREILLSVPHYDFNWQTNYRLAKPKFLPKGTVLQCVAHFDNSESNLNNPNAGVAVRWGEQTFDEMMQGFFEAAPAEEGVGRRWNMPGVSISAYSVFIVFTVLNVTLAGALILWVMRSKIMRLGQNITRAISRG